MSSIIKIAIADDNPALVKVLELRLSLVSHVEVVYRCYNGKELVDWISSTGVLPDVVLMDIEMPVMDGIEATARVHRLFPSVRIIMLTVFGEEDKIFQSIKAGAKGYYLKDIDLDVLLAGISDAINGGAPMSPEVALKAIHLLANSTLQNTGPVNKPEDKLSDREWEVLKYISQGLKNKEIADKLFISPATVKKHIENIYSKVELRSRVEIANLYKGLR